MACKAAFNKKTYTHHYMKNPGNYSEQQTDKKDIRLKKPSPNYHSGGYTGYKIIHMVNIFHADVFKGLKLRVS